MHMSLHVEAVACCRTVIKELKAGGFSSGTSLGSNRYLNLVKVEVTIQQCNTRPIILGCPNSPHRWALRISQSQHHLEVFVLRIGLPGGIWLCWKGWMPTNESNIRNIDIDNRYDIQMIYIYMSVSVLVWVSDTNKSQQTVGNNTFDSCWELEDFMYHDYSSALKKYWK